jgi:hypothetical protein
MDILHALNESMNMITMMLTPTTEMTVPLAVKLVVILAVMLVVILCIVGLIAIVFIGIIYAEEWATRRLKHATVQFEDRIYIGKKHRKATHFVKRDVHDTHHDTHHGTHHGTHHHTANAFYANYDNLLETCQFIQNAIMNNSTILVDRDVSYVLMAYIIFRDGIDEHRISGDVLRDTQCLPNHNFERQLLYVDEPFASTPRCMLRSILNGDVRGIHACAEHVNTGYLYPPLDAAIFGASLMSPTSHDMSFRDERHALTELLFDLGARPEMRLFREVVRAGDVRLAELFLRAGIDIHAEPREREEPILDLAARSNNARMISLLQDRGLRSEKSIRCALVRRRYDIASQFMAVQEINFDLLREYVCSNNLEVVSFLLKQECIRKLIRSHMEAAKSRTFEIRVYPFSARFPLVDDWLPMFELLDSHGIELIYKPGVRPVGKRMSREEREASGCI